MNIGVDIDGVILDLPDRIRAYAEYYDLEVLKKDGVKKKDELKLWKRYSWNDEESKEFVNNNFLKIAKECKLLPFTKEILSKLKEENNKIIIISARGDLVGEEMIEVANKQLEEANIKYDKIYWNISDKVKVCKEEKIDFMIDDYANTCEKLMESKIRTIYFRAKDNRKLMENYYLKEVSNWGEIYRYIKENNM